MIIIVYVEPSKKLGCMRNKRYSEFVLAKFWEIVKKSSGSKFKKVSWLGAVVRWPLAGLGTGAPGRVRAGDAKLVR